MTTTTAPDITQPPTDDRKWVQIGTLVSATELGTPEPWISGRNEQIYEADEVKRTDDWVRVLRGNEEVVAFPAGYVFRIEWVDAPDSGTPVTPSFCGLNALHGPHWCPGHGPDAESQIRRGLYLP